MNLSYRLLAGLLLAPLVCAALPTPAFGLRAVGLEESKEREHVADLLKNVPDTAHPAGTTGGASAAHIISPAPDALGRPYWAKRLFTPHVQALRSLPPAAQSAVPPPSTPPPAQLTGLEEPKTILVVEDDEIQLDWLELVALPERYPSAKIYRAATLEEARAQWKEHGPVDRVVTDGRLPDGWSTDWLLEVWRQAPQTPVLLMSSALKRVPHIDQFERDGRPLLTLDKSGPLEAIYPKFDALEQLASRAATAGLPSVPGTSGPDFATGLEEAKELTLEQTQEILGVRPPTGVTHGVWVPAQTIPLGVFDAFDVTVVDRRIPMHYARRFSAIARSIVEGEPTGRFGERDIVFALPDTPLTFAAPPALTIRFDTSESVSMLHPDVLYSLKTAAGSKPVVVYYWHAPSDKLVEIDGRPGYLFFA